MRFLLRVVFTAVAIWLVTLFLPGIQILPFGPAWWHVAVTTLGVALVFALVNATLGNLIRIVAFPLYILTLGIVALFVNAFLLMIVHWISQSVGFGIRVESFWLGMLAAVCIGFLTWLITIVTRPIFGKERPRER
ncbi:phage holin family protein [Agrococcus sp. HG114]|uniref:phage holin family protein n=1 Tax=Agrococcus sp. HG114 TaxID=2969757 RepID=UPI00215ACAEF|nr:phage holin family protein [Agrococcus sp. HG114]MCR8671398.1 phage holin family protein [Agrococcus sp. HG114]